MKFTMAFLALMGFYSVMPVKAQDKFLDSSISSSKTNVERHVLDNASDKVNKGIDNLLSGNAFKKKHKGATTETTGVATTQIAEPEKGKTQIVISNTNYQALAEITDAIKSNVQVTDVEKSFADGVGTLKISHSCTSDQLLDDLVKKAGNKFEVAGIENGRINLKMK